MRFRKLYQSSVLPFCLLASSLALAQPGAYGPGPYDNNDNRANDLIFNQPATNGGTQFLLGLGELVGSVLLLRNPLPQATAVQDAQNKLAAAIDAPTSDAQRQATHEEIMSDAKSYKSGIVREGPLTDAASYRLEELSHSRVQTLAEKQIGVENAMFDVAEARLSFVKAAASRGLIPKVFRGVRNIGGGYLLIDTGMRAWIWGAMDKNPTLSPLKTFLSQESKQFSRK